MNHNSYMKEIDLEKPYQFFFETLGNQTRLDIIHLLKKEPHNVGDISNILDYEQSLVSHHLKRLLSCGFVNVKIQANQRIYNLNAETIEPLLNLVDQHVNTFCKKVCCAKKTENK